VAQPFFFDKKNPTNPTKFGIIKTAKNKFKLGRKKKQINKTPPTLNKKIRSNQISLAL